jgi:nucleotide-binding universal stress UspA family protein
MIAMNQQAQPEPSRIVLVVGVDLTEVSEHLLRHVRDLVRSIDQTELHVVHVVPPEPLRPWVPESSGSLGSIELVQARTAYWQLCRMWDSIAPGSTAHFIVHTPVGRPADELTRVARSVGADIIVLEAHDHTGRRRLFHRSLLARVTQTAPCSVLAIRDPRSVPPTGG